MRLMAKQMRSSGVRASGSTVITSASRVRPSSRPWRTTRVSRSRSVKIPTSRPAGSTITTPARWLSTIRVTASATEASGGRRIGSLGASSPTLSLSRASSSLRNSASRDSEYSSWNSLIAATSGVQHARRAVTVVSMARSHSKQVLPKGRGLPQNRCYRRHRKGAPVTEHTRREYAAVMRPRYQQADKRERGRLLDEYCRTTGCHRKAAIRRLRGAPSPPGRAPGRPARYAARELGPTLERAWLASDQLSGKLLRPILPALLTALATHHGVGMTPAVRAALTAASAATLDRLLRPRRLGGPGAAVRPAPPATPLLPARPQAAQQAPGRQQGPQAVRCRSDPVSTGARRGRARRRAAAEARAAVPRVGPDRPRSDHPADAGRPLEARRYSPHPSSGGSSWVTEF